MNRSGIGSASVVLIFAVLCMAIFSVISLVTALNEEKLVESEVALVTSYYAADALAEEIFAEILATRSAPEEISGVAIESFFDNYLREIISFMCPVSETHGLFVSAAIGFDSHEILSWRMVHLAEWHADDRINVWQGEFDENFMSGW
jgi:hypothetical protein